MMNYTVLAFYKFIKLSNIISLRAMLEAECQKNGILGTILLAEEGINGTIAGSMVAIQSFQDFMTQQNEFSDSSGIEYKISYTDTQPFKKMKVLIKKEIVTFGIPTTPSEKTGIPVSATVWNELLTDPEMIVIDTRNTYEVEKGSFKSAINPNTQSFNEFPRFVKENLDPKRHKKIAMFCTGGIRCEKASSYLLEEGFETVYQLQGGILKYIETMKGAVQQNNPWQGDCFVFDQREVYKS